MNLLIAAALPLIWWTGEPGAAGDVNTSYVCVDSAAIAKWKNASVRECPSGPHKRALTPATNPKVNVASATRSPWIDSNGWLFRRDPSAIYVYEEPGRKSALAAAEAYAYGVRALVRAGADYAPRAAAMLRFLERIGDAGAPDAADVWFVDDGSAQAGEAMNLMNRRNILFRRATPNDKPEGRVVRIGSPEFPASLLANPSEFAYKVRRWVGDDNRMVRIYGTENVLAHVTGVKGSTRVHLLNYTGNAVEGIRLRLAGNYTGVALHAFDAEDSQPQDVSITAGAIEFTIPALKEYAAIDLKR